MDGEKFFANLNSRFESLDDEKFEQGFQNPDLILELRRMMVEIRKRVQGALLQAAEGNAEVFRGVLNSFPQAIKVIEVTGRHGDGLKISEQTIMDAYLSEKARGFMEELGRDQGVPLLHQVCGSNETVIRGEIIVPPNPMVAELANNGGANDLDLSLRPRYELCQEALQEIGITPNDYVVYRGCVSEEMVRTEPYFLLAIPGMNRLILICDQYGNRTFVVRGKGEKVVSRYQKMNKEALKSDAESRNLTWTENPALWKEKLKALLKDDLAWEKTQMPSVVPQIRDSEYYSDPSNVKKDLEAFAKALSEALGAEKTVEDLNTGNISKLAIRCANGEEVLGETYLNNACILLGLAGNSTEARGKTATIKKLLRWIVGYEVYEERDSEYYSDPSNVKKDLEAFAKALSEALGAEKTVEDLNTRNISSLAIRCANGEEVLGQTYLNNAGILLGLAGNNKEARSKTATALKLLRWIVGYEVYEERDREYYSDPSNVKKDLEAFAKALSEALDAEKTVEDLNTGNISKLAIRCANGEEVLGQTYLNNAGILLGLAGNNKEATSKTATALKLLRWIVGYEVYEERDREYYSDPSNVKKDLEAFAKALSEALGAEKTVEDLNTRNISSFAIRCANGEEVLGKTYLNNAGILLGLARNTDESMCRHREILNLLRRIAAGEKFPTVENTSSL